MGPEIESLVLWTEPARRPKSLFVTVNLFQPTMNLCLVLKHFSIYSLNRISKPIFSVKVQANCQKYSMTPCMHHNVTCFYVTIHLGFQLPAFLKICY